MRKTNYLKAVLAGGASALAFAATAHAANFNIPGGDLETALNAYSIQAVVPLIVSDEAIKGARTKGAKGELTAAAALSRILEGTGFRPHRTPTGAIAVVEDTREDAPRARESANRPLKLAAATAASVETVVVTSSKIKGDIQTVPIAITALSQEQLTSRQIAGGPDLVKEVPNLTFSKTNFTGYNIQIRGIGTQAISVTTDPAVAVAFNDIPFLRNHFFEQEFFDVSQVEVLRGPQGTLYGRNAPAGVVNVISAKPTDHFEARLSADWGNYTNRRYEGMVNIPIWSDKIDLRVAGEWTKRKGYAYNDVTKHQIDGRDLFTTRVSLLVHPFEKLSANLIWEHFQENDDRARSTKQLCARDNAPAVVDGPAGPQVPTFTGFHGGTNYGAGWLTQGCHAASLYAPESYETPNGAAIPFLSGYGALGMKYIALDDNIDPYAGLTQSRDLRTVSSQLDPYYRAKNDTFEANIDFQLTPDLTLTSQTGYNKDFLYSTEDFNRFNTREGFLQDAGGGFFGTYVGQDQQYCDPQLGCSSRFVAEDRSSENARQLYQEVRLTSSFKGPWNFVLGGNYLNYRTKEDYYVFSNLLTLFQEQINRQFGGGIAGVDAPHISFDADVANSCDPQPADPTKPIGLLLGLGCGYIDPNPIDRVDGQGHNYFLSHNPYKLKSWATFGEVYYQVSPDVKLTGGLRYTDDKKDFPVFPSWALLAGKGVPQTDEIVQEWREVTGRAVVDWTPKLDFTDQTLVYASFAHGYKGGGANPPPVTSVFQGSKLITSPGAQTHPLTFKPEFNNAFELGTKNTLGDGALTLNADVFFYKYKNYQISYIVDRTSVNLNFNATVRGAELESSWSPVPGLRFGFAGGYEDATIDSGQSAIDLMDRTGGHTDWLVVKPWVNETSNCILPSYVVNELLRFNQPGSPPKTETEAITNACLYAYTPGTASHYPDQLVDPATTKPYAPDPDPVNLPGYPGFDPYAAPNNGEGFDKDLGGNQMPNAPHFTASLTADFTMPVSANWAGTIHGDFYWQSQSFARVFNDRPYDKLRGYSNVNLALILTDASGWQVMGYVKNVFDTTAITGAFLNSDDTALTTNIFVTDPRLYGVRVTKTF